MSQTGTSTKQQKSDASVTRVAMNLEVDVIPVSDVERSKQFYQLLGWRLDADDAPGKNVRIVQFTPPGSGCSVTFGNGLTTAAPGSAAGLTAMRGWSRRSQRGSPAASDTAVAPTAHLTSALRCAEAVHDEHEIGGFPARAPTARNRVAASACDNH